MSTTATIIPVFGAITLLISGFNKLGAQLTFVGILAIILHAAITPTELSGPYPDFDNYHPTQPPFRDYVLVFGLAGLVLVALFSRFCPSLWSLARSQPALKVCDTGADGDSFPTPRTPSPSHTFTGQWTTTESTLAVGSTTSITPQATGPREVTAPSEVIALELRVSQFEVAMEELRCRVGDLTTGEQSAASGIATPSATKRLPIHTPASPLITDIVLPPSTRPLSPSPSPLDPSTTPFAPLKPVDGTIDAREHLRSLVESIMEGTRETDQLIYKMRNILAEADTTGDTTFEGCEDEDDVPPASTSRPAQVLLDPTIRRVKDTSPLPTAANWMSETARGSPRTPKLDVALDFLYISQAPCSTPLRSAKEAEESISPSPSSLRVLEADFGPRNLSPAPPKRAEEADAKAHPTSRATPNPAKIPRQDSTPRYKYDFISRIRERPSKTLYPPSPRAGVESSLDTRRIVKGKGKAVRALQSMSDWLAERKRTSNIPSKFRAMR